MAAATPSRQIKFIKPTLLKKLLSFVSLSSALILVLRSAQTLDSVVWLTAAVAAVLAGSAVLESTEASYPWPFLSLISFIVSLLISHLTLPPESLIPDLLLLICLGYAFLQFPLGFWIWLPSLLISDQAASILQKSLGMRTANLPLSASNRVLTGLTLVSLSLAVMIELEKQLAKIKYCYHLIHLGKLSKIFVHEINNPIMASLYWLNQLEKAKSSDKQKSVLEQLKQEITLVKEIISYHRNPDPSPSKFRVRPILRQIKNTLKHKAQKRQVKIKLHFTNHDCLQLTGVPGFLYQAISNLVANAIEAYPQPDSTRQLVLHEPKTVVIAAAAKNNQLVIKVKDQGEGISPKNKKSVYQTFFTTKNDQSYNLGLGLTISRSLIRRKFKGSLKLISEPGQGTTAIVQLPLRQQTS